MRLENGPLKMSEELEKLLRQASRVGKLDSQGVFEVELSRARGDLGKNFAVAYPGHYGLKFIQSAVALGARSIEVSSASDRLHISFDCPPDAELLVSEEGLLKVTDKASSTAAVSLLLQAIWGSLFDDALKVQFYLQLGEESLRVTFDLEGVKTESFSRAPGGVDSLEFFVHRQSRNRKKEQKLLKQRCGYCPVPLKMNNLRLDGTAWKNERCVADKNLLKRYAPSGFRLAETYLNAASQTQKTYLGLPEPETRGFRIPARDMPEPESWQPQSDNTFCGPQWDFVGPYDAALALPVELAGYNKLLAVQFGVSLEPVFFQDALAPGAFAVVDCSRYGLETDLFGFRLVENEALNRAKVELSSEFQHLAEAVRGSIEALVAKKRLRWTSKHQMGFGVALTGWTLAMGAPFITIAAGGVQMLNALIMKSGPAQVEQDNKNFREAVHHALS